MPLHVFLQVKKIYKENIIVSFLQTQTLLTIKFVFSNVFSLEFEKIITQTYCINYLDFLTIKNLTQTLDMHLWSKQ